MNEIRTSGPLSFTEPDCPTRVGEKINTLSEIYDIPMPRLGMRVFVKDEGISYIITGLKDKTIEGVVVPDAQVDKYESIGTKDVENEIKSKALNYSTVHTSTKADEVNIGGESVDGNNTMSVNIPAATEYTAGVMTATDKKKLNNLAVEGANVDLNTYYLAGVYFFHSKRLTNVPILNDSVVSARLTVLAAYDGSSPVITQVLNLNNLGGGEGNVYIRSQQNDTWKPWGKLQTNVEVGQITPTDMSNLIDNGIYSGVCVDGATVETFVLIVINNYLAASQAGFGSYISQLKYSIDLNRGNTVKTRTRDAYGIWDDWVSLDEKSLVNEEKIRAMEAEAELEEKIKENKQLATNAPNLALRALYIAAGATYNTKTGLYSLNGVEDLTEEQISLSYAFKDVVYRLNAPRVLQNIPIRAIFPHRGIVQVSQIFKNIPFNGTGSLGSTKIESFKTVKDINDINNTEMDKMLPCEPNSIWVATFYYCSKLREVWPINTGNVTRMADDTFLGCSSLVELRLYNLKCNLPIQYSPTLSKDSVLYIIKYATPASTITITLHQDAYARLADDADIVAALEAKPLITLVSA